MRCCRVDSNLDSRQMWCFLSETRQLKSLEMVYPAVGAWLASKEQGRWPTG